MKKIYLVFALILLIGIFIIINFSDSSRLEKFPLVEYKIPYEKYCQTSDDCVVNSCCHPMFTMNKYSAPDCTQLVACTLECSSVLDCQNWKPTCINNICGYEILN